MRRPLSSPGVGEESWVADVGRPPFPPTLTCDDVSHPVLPIGWMLRKKSKYVFRVWIEERLLVGRGGGEGIERSRVVR